MGRFNEVYTKAYMLEFLNNGVLKDVFTFSVPPESEEFVYPQRLSETKTFGGSVFNEYGNDTIRISLSGSTFNNAEKKLYKPNAEAEIVQSGAEEIEALKDRIAEFSEDYTLNADKKIYLYDLSGKREERAGLSSIGNSNYWRVFIQNFKYKRDKSRPFSYAYTIEMSAVVDKTKGKKYISTDALKAVKNANTNLTKIQTLIDKAERVTVQIRDISRKCESAKNMYLSLVNRRPLETVRLITAGGLDAVNHIKGGDNTSFYNSASNVLTSVGVLKGLLK